MRYDEDTLLENLEFSVRAFNALKSAKIKNLGDLRKYSREEIKKFRNFGPVTIGDIDNYLESIKFEWDKSNKETNESHSTIKEYTITTKYVKENVVSKVSLINGDNSYVTEDLSEYLEVAKSVVHDHHMIFSDSGKKLKSLETKVKFE